MKVDEADARSPTWAKGLAAVSPLLVFALLWAGLIVTLSWGSFGPIYLVLAACTCALPILGALLATAHQLPRLVAWAMWVTVAIACVAWTWQRALYLRLMPSGPLTYGYFLTDSGATARMLVLTGPTNAVSAADAVLCCAAAIIAWRAGARWSILALLAWWLAAYATFMMPSVYLSGQGEATVFI